MPKVETPLNHTQHITRSPDLGARYRKESLHAQSTWRFIFWVYTDYVGHGGVDDENTRRHRNEDRNSDCFASYDP